MPKLLSRLLNGGSVLHDLARYAGAFKVAGTHMFAG
jgi:hypothetical protein